MRLRQYVELGIFFITFVAMSFLVFIFMNGGAFARELRYDLFLNSPLAGSDLKNGDLLQVSGTSTLTGAGVGNNSFRLVIPKIEVDTPIVIPKDTTKSGILASLEGGVGLYPGSTSPGGTGRAVLLGHSSKASWYRGEYAYIFSLLGKLQAHDRFVIFKDGKKYTYEVADKKILSPQDTNRFLASAVNDSEVDLVTCYPVGGASERTIVIGKLIQSE